jgi:acyl-CoA synthetase (NDP forming)
MAKLDSFFNPKSIAVIGASTNPEKLGYAVVKNLIESGFTNRGVVYPINPTAVNILGLRCYPSVIDVLEPVDLAVIVFPMLYASVGKKRYQRRLSSVLDFVKLGRKG